MHGRRVFGNYDDDVQVVDDLRIIGNSYERTSGITMMIFGLQMTSLFGI